MIMSKWTELRDSLLESMRGGVLDVNEQSKQDFLIQFIEADKTRFHGAICRGRYAGN